MDQLDELVCGVLELSPQELTDGLERISHPSWTSLRHVQLMVGVEEVFSIALTSGEMASITSLGGLRELVTAKGVVLADDHTTT